MVARWLDDLRQDEAGAARLGGRWPRWVALLPIPVGLALVALQAAFASSLVAVSIACFILLYVWIGISLPRGTALMALPLFAVAYLAPVAAAGRLSALTVLSAVCVGLAGVVVGETLAGLSQSLQAARADVGKIRSEMDSIGAELASAADPQAVLPSVALRLSETAGLPDCAVYGLAEGGLVCLASVRDHQSCPERLGLPPAEGECALREQAVQAKGPLLVTSSADPRLSEVELVTMRARHAQAALVVPLVARDEVLGLAELAETREGRGITPGQTATAVSAGRLIALALHDAAVMRAKDEGERRLASLDESSRAVAGAASLEEALSVVTRCGGEALGVSGCVAYEYDPEVEAVVVTARWERAPGSRDLPGEFVPLAESVCRTVLESGRALLESVSDAGLDPAVRTGLESRGEKRRLVVPMPSKDGPVGLLAFVDTEQESGFPDDDLAVATALAGLAGEAVAGARLLRRLSRLSEADAMSGLASHSELHESLALEQARAEDCGSHFSAVMLGLDGLKSLNDRFGHPAGDEVLRRVAALLSERAGADDVVGRWAGDEFLLILAHATAAQARALAEEVCAELSGTPYVAATGEEVPILASFGIAAYPEDASDASGLVDVAEAALGAARRPVGEALEDEEQSRPDDVADVTEGGPPAEAGEAQVAAELPEPAGEPSVAGPAGTGSEAPVPIEWDASAIDQAEMRQRIEETRTRLKVKAFDAMIRGGVSLLAQEGGEAPDLAGSIAGLDGDLAGMVDGAFSEQEY